MTLFQPARVKMSKTQGIVILVSGYLFLLFMSVTGIVLNGSSSLKHNAYFMIAVPKIMAKGWYVTFTPPAPIATKINQEFRFVKRIVGVPGDIIYLKTIDERDAVCIAHTCVFPMTKEDGSPLFDPIPEGVIPEGYFAVFGDSVDSLDSRYSAVGLISKEQIDASGFPIPFPDWRWFL